MAGDDRTVILLIEDNPDHAELIIEALKEHHVQNEIVWQDSGEGGLDFLFCKGEFADDKRAQQPILVLLDIKLPGIDGLEVLKTIKENPETTDIPVVMLTTSREESEILKSYKYHASSYIVKPINFSDFMDAIASLNMYWTIATLPTRGNIIKNE
ncbi:response regulator [bacterium]|nr:response regulator [candidate division CSSED10-310 bacterium]